MERLIVSLHQPRKGRTRGVAVKLLDFMGWLSLIISGSVHRPSGLEQDKCP